MERWESLLEELRAEFLFREEELELLHAIDLQLLESDRPLNATFAFIVFETQQLLKSDHTRILLRRGQFLESAYSTSQSDLGQRLEISASLEGACLRDDRTFNFPDLTTPQFSSRYVPIAGYQQQPIRSLVAAPIKAHDTMVGVITAQSERSNAFAVVHERALVAIAAQVAIALQRAQLFDRTALFADVDELIFETNSSQQVIQIALQRVMRGLQELEHVQLTSAQILFRTGNNLEIVHSTTPSDVGLLLGLDESISGRAVRERRTVVIADVRSEPEWARSIHSSIQSEMAVPIFLGDDSTVIGVLHVESTELDAFQGFSQIILESFADKVKTLLAFAKLRSDVTEALETQHASELLIAVGDQTSNLVHRLNNIVGAMRFRILELQEHWNAKHEGTDDFITESLRNLNQLVERALQMPDDITALLSQEGRALDVNETIKEAVSRVEIPADVAVYLELAESLPQLSLYSFDIVMQNLLRNALDAMPDGGRLSVVTSAFSDLGQSNGFVQVTVKDTGNGVPEDILPRIFDLNFSTKTVKGRGLGLGLWWVRNFVRRAHGEISVTSTINEGTSFVVKLPFHGPPTKNISIEGG